MVPIVRILSHICRKCRIADMVVFQVSSFILREFSFKENRRSSRSQRAIVFAVTNWNGNRTQLERDVDNDRREERKRHFNPDDDEMDRGRIKKIKDRRMYEDRASTSHNSFQEYQNGKNYRSYRRHYYNTSHARSRHGNNRKPHYNRYTHNYSRGHWQHR